MLIYLTRVYIYPIGILFIYRAYTYSYSYKYDWALLLSPTWPASKHFKVQKKVLNLLPAAGSSALALTCSCSCSCFAILCNCCCCCCCWLLNEVSVEAQANKCEALGVRCVSKCKCQADKQGQRSGQFILLSIFSIKLMTLSCLR